MNIIVCIKQVPGTTKVNIDEETGALQRSGVPSKMNPYDLYAIEAALWIKNRTGGEITVLTMGPPQAKDIIQEAFSLGADNGYLLSDRRFAGSDVLATSYALSEAIKHIGGYNIIVCGKQTTDGDTAQVGPSIAQWLNIPHAAWVSQLVAADDAGTEVIQDLGDISLHVRMDYKCLITVEKDILPLRLPSYRTMIKTSGKEITTLSLDDLTGAEEKLCGLKGSPTQVEKIFPPEKNQEHLIFGGTTEELSQKMLDILRENKFL